MVIDFAKAGYKKITRREIKMTLIIILACVFIAVFLMVTLGEKFGKPMTDEQQGKYSKITRILVFVLIVAAIIKTMF